MIDNDVDIWKFVGHTHEDIDAFFGVFSKYLAQTDVYTIDGKRQMS